LIPERDATDERSEHAEKILDKPDVIAAAE
jgi:hypothetical protein